MVFSARLTFDLGFLRPSGVMARYNRTDRLRVAASLRKVRQPSDRVTICIRVLELAVAVRK